LPFQRVVRPEHKAPAAVRKNLGSLLSYANPSWRRRDMSTTEKSVTVTFNMSSSPSFTFGGKDQVNIKTRHGKITYTLVSQDAGVTFALVPIQVVGDLPAKVTVDVQRLGDESAQMDITAPLGTTRFSYNVILVNGSGVTFTSDPTIVIMRPEG
jgi:hypothetical protein